MSQNLAAILVWVLTLPPAFEIPNYRRNGECFLRLDCFEVKKRISNFGR